VHQVGFIYKTPVSIGQKGAGRPRANLDLTEKKKSFPPCPELVHISSIAKTAHMIKKNCVRLKFYTRSY